MATTHADALLAVYVLRALGYGVYYTEDIDGARPSARLSQAIRAFQGAANREHTRALKVDGVLGNDTLNALAFYATQSPYTVARLSSEGLSPEEQRAIQAVINTRRNIPWGLTLGGENGGSGTSNTPTRTTPASSTPTRTTSSSSTSSSATAQASMLSTGVKGALWLGALGAAAYGLTKLYDRHQARQEREAYDRQDAEEEAAFTDELYRENWELKRSLGEAPETTEDSKRSRVASTVAGAARKGRAGVNTTIKNLLGERA